jgi:hypothetical protein
MKHANAKRKEQDELSALYERFSMACNTYQQLMTDFANYQAQQAPVGYQGYQPGYQQSPQPGYQQPPQPGYQQSPQPGYQQPPQPGYQQPY